MSSAARDTVVAGVPDPDHRGAGHRGAGRRGWRVLAGFWLCLLLAGGGAAGWLQYTAPRQAAPDPPVRAAEAAAPAPAPARTSAPVAPTVPMTPPPTPAAVTGASETAMKPGDPIAAPVAALLEPAPGLGGAGLPRVVPGQRSPMQVYAGGFDPRDHRPRIALLLVGIGLSDADSEDAIRLLPAGVTLGVSPYAARPEPLLEKARARGHEFLISLPMEGEGYPLNDEGPHALLTGNNTGDNLRQLQWSLSRIAGYAGATGAMDGMRGERFAASREQMRQVLDDLAGRGVFYVDPRPTTAPGDQRPGEPAPAHGYARSVDVLVDEPPVRTEIEAKLAQLEQIAHDRGQALGLAGLPRPVTLDRIAAWSGRLDARGFALVPVSALLQPTTTAAQR